ncbi:hypothetical protein IFM89_035774 [Coptis chinensis]|uniref:CCHC-type domain-containing protein n=1 Tax=Coptis chinensis TaxID=261450 RepID=A0A835I734_9MAGN|nr:hypothetical protein IFM89_035774 [Coptis chinensis]
MSEDRKVFWVATRLRGFALIWWTEFLQQRLCQNLGQVTTWERMKEALVTKFIPMNYAQQLHRKLQDFKQDSKTVQEYTESFYHLQSRCNQLESEEVRICCYMHSLRGDIRYDLVHVRINTLEEAYSFVSESEKKMSYMSSMSSYRATPIVLKKIVKCYSCGQEGHVQANCPKKPVLT